VLFGLRERTAGETLLDGRPVHPKNPRDAIDAGIGLVGADRKASGLVMSMSIEQNIAMVATRGTSRWRPAGRRRERAQASEHAQSMRIVAPSLSAPVGQLSGGNQQKVVLAKWMQMQPRLLLLDEPTRGVDVAAKLEIYELLRRAREGGTSILLSSSEIPELLAVCDRIVVMARRRVRISLEASQTDETEIVSYATAID
jgi:ABC-type sugar transport system ATPase subunit